MGLFSARYEYFAYAGSSSLFEEDQRPDNHKQAILESSLRGLMSISDSIVYSINTDYFARAKAMQRFAARPVSEGGYVRGFPTARFIRIIVPDEEVIAAIERNTGDVVREDGLISNQYGQYDEKFFINYEVQKYYAGPLNNGSINDGVFTWENGPPSKELWCAEDSEIEIPIVGPDGNYIRAENPYFEYVRNSEVFVDPNEPGLDPNPEQPFDPVNPPPVTFNPVGPGLNPQDYIYTVKWKYTNPETGEDSAFSIKLNLIGYVTVDYEVDGGNTWLRTSYLVEGDDCVRYWTYLVGSGEDPIFESVIDRTVRNAQFLPVAVLQQDKIWYDEQPDAELKRSTDRLLKKVMLDGPEIKESFLEQEAEDDESGDEQRVDAEKWDFFIHYAVPIRTNVRGSREYLFHFFDEMKSFTRWTREKYEEYLEKRLTQDPDSLFSMIQPIDELTIREGFENGYAVNYAWSYIEYKETLDERLEYDDEFDENGLPKKMRYKDARIEILERNDESTYDRYVEIIELMHGEGALIGPETEDPERDGYHDFMFIEYQNRDILGDGTEFWYVERILIMGLSMAYKINTSDNAGEGYRFRYAIPNLFGTEEETKEFRIPVSMNALRKVGVVRREDVITDAMAATVFLVRVEKVKWYQRSFFKWLIVIIAVILIVVAVFFPATLVAAANLLGTALGISATLALKFIAFAIGFVTAFAGALVGGTAGQILALVGAIASMGVGLGAGQAGVSWTGAFQNWGASAFTSWGSALSFVGSVANIANSAMKVYAAYELEQLQDDFRDFLETAREKQQQLEDAWAGLGDTPGWINPMSLVQTLASAPAETPGEFYSRTLNPNPGILGYDLVYRFADTALQLPDKPTDENIIETQFNTFAAQRGAA
jgi:hypothetical protein